MKRSGAEWVASGQDASTMHAWPETCERYWVEVGGK